VYRTFWLCFDDEDDDDDDDRHRLIFSNDNNGDNETFESAGGQTMTRQEASHLGRLSSLLVSGGRQDGDNDGP
jgi:hypothetical protein